MHSQQQQQQEHESSLDKYVRLDKQHNDEPGIQDHEIRITGPGKTRNYIAYATGLLTQKGCTSVELKAMGQAINKTVTIAEIIKRRILGLHQNNQITSIAIQDTWEPIEEGLDTISVTRHVSVVSITLSTVPLDRSRPGYQPPLPAEMVKTHLSPAPHNGPVNGEGDIWSRMVAGQISGSNMHLGSAGVLSSSVNNSGLNGGGLHHPVGMGAAGAGDGSSGSSKPSSGSVLDGYAMSMPLSAALAAQQLLQAQGLHEGSPQLGLQPDLNIGPVAHFDGRDHARTQGKGRGHRGGGGSSSNNNMGIDGGMGGMLGPMALTDGSLPA